ncbi:hypothetical protein ABZ470_34340 [Streptosporangium sp. NPDC020072]|uniref:hypothetical protein n=1 Tax=Streptosporangium sp. NPDC020072 TaxID=3154788 RepID=UPI003424F4B8
MGTNTATRPVRGQTTALPDHTPRLEYRTFTSTPLNILENGLCVDRRQVYATGRSNGDGLAGLPACRMAVRIAAISPRK